MIAVVVGLVFAVYPRLDLDISALFFAKTNPMFVANAQLWVQRTRDAARLLVTLLVAPAFLALLGKLILPRRRMLIAARTALFLVLTLAIGPGLFVNTLLKDHWGRARPIDVNEFGGDSRFTPWWDPRGDCSNNCSFVAGEPSGAFWTLALASLTSPQWRLLAYGGALAFGAAVGLLRIAGGAHFFTDVVFSGVFTYLVIWTAYGAIYRWRPTRMTDDAIERPLIQAGLAIRGAVSALARRIAEGGGKDT
jgi:lipid A 4'-phosphatase